MGMFSAPWLESRIPPSAAMWLSVQRLDFCCGWLEEGEQSGERDQEDATSHLAFDRVWFSVDYFVCLFIKGVIAESEGRLRSPLYVSCVLGYVKCLNCLACKPGPACHELTLLFEWKKSSSFLMILIRQCVYFVDADLLSNQWNGVFSLKKKIVCFGY